MLRKTLVYEKMVGVDQDDKDWVQVDVNPSPISVLKDEVSIWFNEMKTVIFTYMSEISDLASK